MTFENTIHLDMGGNHQLYTPQPEKDGDVPERHHVINTIALATNRLMTGYFDYPPSRDINLYYLGDIREGSILQGTLQLKDHSRSSTYERISYCVEQIGGTSMILTQVEPRLKKKTNKPTRYVLNNIQLMYDGYAAGTISSPDGKPKGEFLFSIESFCFSKSRSRGVAWRIGAIVLERLKRVGRS